MLVEASLKRPVQAVLLDDGEGARCYIDAETPIAQALSIQKRWSGRFSAVIVTRRRVYCGGNVDNKSPY